MGPGKHTLTEGLSPGPSASASHSPSTPRASTGVVTRAPGDGPSLQSLFGPPAPVQAAGGDTIPDPRVGASAPLAMPHATQSRLEATTGVPADGVTLHEQPRLADNSIRALAHGRSIYFAPGEYQPTTPSGFEVLSHEFTHLRQTSGAAASPSGPVRIANDPAAEHQADQVAQSASAGQPAASWTPVQASGDAHALLGKVTKPRPRKAKTQDGSQASAGGSQHEGDEEDEHDQAGPSTGGQAAPPSAPLGLSVKKQKRRPLLDLQTSQGGAFTWVPGMTVDFTPGRTQADAPASIETIEIDGQRTATGLRLGMGSSARMVALDDPEFAALLSNTQLAVGDAVRVTWQVQGNTARPQLTNLGAPIQADADFRRIHIQDNDLFRQINRTLGEQSGTAFLQLFPYMGNKQTLRHFVIDQLIAAAQNQGGQVNHLIEPFMGAATLLLSWPQNQHRIDRHTMGDINRLGIDLMQTLHTVDIDRLTSAYNTVHREAEANEGNTQEGLNKFLTTLNAETASTSAAGAASNNRLSNENSAAMQTGDPAVPSQPVPSSEAGQGGGDNRQPARSAADIRRAVRNMYYMENTRGGVHRDDNKWSATFAEKQLENRETRFADRVNKFQEVASSAHPEFLQQTWQQTIDFARQQSLARQRASRASAPQQSPGPGQTGAPPQSAGSSQAAPYQSPSNMIVYCDPPYPTSDMTPDTVYGPPFTMANLGEVLQAARDLADLGTTVVVSNYYNEGSAELIGETPGETPGIPAAATGPLAPTMTFIFPVWHISSFTREILLIYAPPGSPLNVDLATRRARVAALQNAGAPQPAGRRRGTSGAPRKRKNATTTETAKNTKTAQGRPDKRPRKAPQPPPSSSQSLGPPDLGQMPGQSASGQAPPGYPMATSLPFRPPPSQPRPQPPFPPTMQPPGGVSLPSIASWFHEDDPRQGGRLPSFRTSFPDNDQQLPGLQDLLQSHQPQSGPLPSLHATFPHAGFAGSSQVPPQQAGQVPPMRLGMDADDDEFDSSSSSSSESDSDDEGMDQDMPGWNRPPAHPPQGGGFQGGFGSPWTGHPGSFQGGPGYPASFQGGGAGFPSTSYQGTFQNSQGGPGPWTGFQGNFQGGAGFQNFQGAPRLSTGFPSSMSSQQRPSAPASSQGGDCLYDAVRAQIGQGAADAATLRRIVTSWVLEHQNLPGIQGLGEEYVTHMLEVLSTPGAWYGTLEAGNMAPIVLASALGLRLRIVSVFRGARRVYEIRPRGQATRELELFFQENHYTPDPVPGVHDNWQNWDRTQL